MLHEDSVRAFIGCAANNEDLESQAVLEWSLRKHSALPLEIHWMRLSREPESAFYCNYETGEGWKTELWATPFSGFRWAVPALCNFEGRGVYLDSDFIVLADIAELWRQPFEPGKVVLAKGGDAWRLCCSLWDCLAAKEQLPSLNEIKGAAAHRQLTSKFGPNSGLVQPFSGDWNNLDGRDGVNLKDPNLKALHYTDMNCQPQLRYAIPRLQSAGKRHWYDGRIRLHPREDVRILFDRLLEEAKANGYPPERYIVPEFGPYRKRSFSRRR